MDQQPDAADVVIIFAHGAVAALLTWLTLAGLAHLLALDSHLDWAAWLLVPPVAAAGLLHGRTRILTRRRRQP